MAVPDGMVTIARYMPSYSSPEIRFTALVKPTDVVPDPLSKRIAGFASSPPDVVRRPETSSVMRFTVTVPPRLLTRAGETVAETSTGGLVSCVGVAAFDGADGAETPMALVAVTLNVYATPFVSPGT